MHIIIIIIALHLYGSNPLIMIQSPKLGGAEVDHHEEPTPPFKKASVHTTGAKHPRLLFIGIYVESGRKAM
jgi:hypothetical protein